MAGAGLSTDVQAFLHDCMESYEELEILLLLRSRPDESWESSTVGTELHMPEAVAERALGALCHQGLLSVAVLPGRRAFCYRPNTAELAALVEKLGEAYADHRIEVVRLMTANSIERLRARALRTFANAFLVGKKGGSSG